MRGGFAALVSFSAVGVAAACAAPGHCRAGLDTLQVHERGPLYLDGDTGQSADSGDTDGPQTAMLHVHVDADTSFDVDVPLERRADGGWDAVSGDVGADFHVCGGFDGTATFTLVGAGRAVEPITVAMSARGPSEDVDVALWGGWDLTLRWLGFIA